MSGKIENGFQPGSGNLHMENWGDLFEDVSKTVIAVFDTADKIVRLVKFSGGDQFCVRSVIVDPKHPNSTLYVLAYHQQPIRFGLPWITQRPSALIKLEGWQKDQPTSKIIVGEKNNLAILGLSVSPDGENVVWFQSPAGGPHNRAFELHNFNTSNEKLTQLTDRKVNPLCLGSAIAPLRSRCWLSDNKTLVFTVFQKAATVIKTFNVETKDMTTIRSKNDTNNSLFLLDIVANQALIFESSPICPVSLAIYHLPKETVRLSESLFKIDDRILAESISWSLESIRFSNFDIEYFLIRSKVGKFQEKSRPMIVYAHGGPHGTVTSNFAGSIEDAVAFAMTGFDVCLVNYCGTLGYDSLEALPGRIGHLDVESIHCCVQDALKKEPGRNACRRVYLNCISFGGYITLHLLSKYPEFYRAAVLINPVTDLTLMAHVADCPDWVFAETGNLEGLKGFPKLSTMITDPDISAKINSFSPFHGINNYNSPMLFALGKKDARIPNCSSLSLIRMLKQVNSEIPIEYVAIFSPSPP